MRQATTVVVWMERMTPSQRLQTPSRMSILPSFTPSYSHSPLLPSHPLYLLPPNLQNTLIMTPFRPFLPPFQRPRNQQRVPFYCPGVGTRTSLSCPCTQTTPPVFWGPHGGQHGFGFQTFYPPIVCRNMRVSGCICVSVRMYIYFCAFQCRCVCLPVYVHVCVSVGV